MRKILLVLLFTASLLGSAQDNNPPLTPADSLAVYLDSLDVENFTDLPVDSFLKVLPPGYTSFELSEADKPEYGGMLSVSYYPQSLYVSVYIKAFRHANPNGIFKKRKWRLVKKETVAAVRIRNEVACLEGCK